MYQFDQKELYKFFAKLPQGDWELIERKDCIAAKREFLKNDNIINSNNYGFKVEEYVKECKFEKRTSSIDLEKKKVEGYKCEISLCEISSKVDKGVSFVTICISKESSIKKAVKGARRDFKKYLNKFNSKIEKEFS